MLMHDDDQDQDGLESEPLTPQDWGFPEKPTHRELQCWENQQRFLRRYAERGKFVLSAADAGISIQAIYKWQHSDKFNFNKRFELAYQAYRETLEEDMDEYIRETKHNSQIIQIFRMKAAWPEKYRDDAKPQQTDAAQELLDRLTAMAARDIEERRRLESQSTSVEYRELDDKG
jgi:hypothetical protein